MPARNEAALRTKIIEELQRQSDDHESIYFSHGTRGDDVVLIDGWVNLTELIHAIQTPENDDDI